MGCSEDQRWTESLQKTRDKEQKYFDFGEQPESESRDRPANKDRSTRYTQPILTSGWISDKDLVRQIPITARSQELLDDAGTWTIQNRRGTSNSQINYCITKSQDQAAVLMHFRDVMRARRHLCPQISMIHRKCRVHFE
jgi:hypothetical protein